MKTQRKAALPRSLEHLHSVTVMCGKLHRLHVTGADLDYVDKKDRNSITIDPDLLEAVGWCPLMQVHINNTSVPEKNVGIHWETYIKAGERGKGEVILNGPPAHMFKKDDIIIVVAYGAISPSLMHLHKPTVVLATQDGQNKVAAVMSEEAFKGWLVDEPDVAASDSQE